MARPFFCGKDSSPAGEAFRSAAQEMEANAGRANSLVFGGLPQAN